MHPTYCLAKITLLGLCLGLELSAQTAPRFDRPVRLMPGPESWGVYLSDVNGDGRMDVVACGGRQATIRPGLSDGSFGAPVPFDVAAPAGEAQLVDVTGDGKADFVKPVQGGVGIEAGRGDGTFDPLLFLPLPNAVDQVLVADFDGDGRQDILAYSTSRSGAFVLSRPRGVWTPLAIDFPHGVGPAMARDANGDGVLDLLLGGQSALEIWVHRGGFRFEKAVSYPAEFWVLAVGMADLTGDGVADLVVQLSDPVLQAAKFMVLPGRPGSFPQDARVSQPTPYSTDRMVVGDFNADGVSEVGMIEGETLRVRGFRPDAGGLGMNTLVEVPLGSAMNTLVCGDLDGNPKPDLVMLADSGAVPVLLRNLSEVPAFGIHGFTPKIGAPGTEVILDGSGFTYTREVTFSGKPADFTVQADGQVKATVPEGAVTGPIRLTTPLGTATSAEPFTVRVPDGEPPMVVLEGLPKASGVTPLFATASDNVGVVRVEWLVNGTLAGQGEPVPGQPGKWTYALDVSPLMDGVHELTVRAVDAQGNLGASAPAGFTVNNTFEILRAEAEGATTLSVGTPQAFKSEAKVLKPGTTLVFRWRFSDGTTKEGASVFHTFLAPGGASLSLEVVASNGTREQVQRSYPVLAKPVFVEREPNGNWATPNLVDIGGAGIGYGAIQGGYHVSKDRDYFLVKLPAGETLRLDMTGAVVPNSVLDIYSSTGIRLMRADGASATKTLTWTNASSTPATLRVLAFHLTGSIAGNYLIQLTRTR